MKNWNTDTTRLKQNSSAYQKWRLEQLINYGLDGEKIEKEHLLKYWDEIDIDPGKRRYLALLLGKDE